MSRFFFISQHPMEEETINRIVLAIQTQLSPAATQSQRQEAQQYCEEFKNNARSAYFAFHLLHSKFDAPVRHFGLLLLETRIKTDWQIFSEQQRDGIRKSVLNFIAGGTNDVLEEQQYIKEKGAALVVEIAKRDWPQKWKTLVPNLFEIARAGEKQIELVLLVLKNLVLEVKEYNDDLPTSRRKDLSNALLHEAEGIFNFFYQVLEMSYGKYKAAKEQNSPTLKKDIILVTTALTAIHSYFDLTPIDQVLKYNLHAIFCLVLGDIPFRMVACEGILTLLSRKEKEKSDSVKLLFPFQSMEGIAASLKQSTGDQALDYNYSKSLAKVLIQLGLNNLSNFNPQQLPPNYQPFLDLMLEITAHPSLVITYETIVFWQRLLDNTYFRQNIDMKGLCFRLLEALDEKIPKWNRSSEEASKNFATWRGAFFWKMDFEYNDEFMHFYSQARSKFGSFLTQIATIAPAVSLEFVGKKFGALTASIAKSNAQNLQKTSLEVVYFEACDMQISSIMNGVNPTLFDPANPEAQHTIALTEGLLKLIFDFSSTEPLLVEHQIAALKYFKKYYQVHQTSLEVVLTKLLSLVLFKRPNEPTLDTLSKPTLEARRKAATTFIYLCDTLPDKLVQHVPMLIVAVKDMFGQLLDSEKIYLIEALASVSNGMKSFEAQAQYLSQLLANVEEEWLAPAVQECCTTIDQFLTTLNIHPQATPAQREQNAPVCKAKRGAIYRLVNTFYYIWKRVSMPSTPEELVQGGYLDTAVAMQIMNEFQEDPSVKKKKIDETEMRTRLKQRLHRASRHPLSAHTRRIAPSILALTRSLQALWSPTVRQALPADSAAIFQIDPARASALLNPSQEQPKQTPNRENDLAMMRHWLESMREVCYSLIGKFIGEQQGSAVRDLAFPQSLLFNFEHIENRHLSIFIRRVLKKIMVLPSEENQDLINFLAQSCLFIFDRLMKSWATKLAAAAQPFTPNNEETIAAEVINEALLHNLSREFSAFMKEMLFQMSHSWTGSTHVDMSNTPAPSAIFNYLLQQNMAKPILSGVIECLKFPDSTIFSNTFAVCCALLPVLFGQPEQLLQGAPMQFDQERLGNYAKLIGQDLVTNLLAVLWTPIGQERHAQILGAIGLIFLFLRAVSQATGSEQYLNLMFQIFTKLPNANDAAVIALRDMLYKSKPNTVRNVLRSFLADVCNLKMGGDGKKPSNIVEHSEKVLNTNKLQVKAQQQQAENDSFAAMLEALYTDDR